MLLSTSLLRLPSRVAIDPVMRLCSIPALAKGALLAGMDGVVFVAPPPPPQPLSASKATNTKVWTKLRLHITALLDFIEYEWYIKFSLNNV